jgi:hypothetical protein
MDFGPFAIISLIYVLLGLRVVVQLVQRWRETFDRRFTPADRALVDQAAFFVLVPISVALHELGHAVAIWAFGGRVVGWGYFAFAGYVQYDADQFTAAQRVVIASAGTVVNLALGAAAVAFVFLRRPPMRAAFNELLIQFTFVSLVNALVVYPLLDLSTGLNGDWFQMYRGGEPALSLVILVIHAAALAALLWLWRSQRARERIAALTAAGPVPRRLRLGSSTPPTTASGSSVERVLHEAAGRVASGWPLPLEATIQQQGEVTILALTWTDDGARRTVLAVARPAGGVELLGAAGGDGIPAQARVIARDPGVPDPDRLTLALRMAMESVAVWTPGAAPAPSA